jgi:PAS domain S-box-containing protein
MKKSKILIVEDERIPAEAVAKTLEYLGYEVTDIVSTAKRALEEVEKKTPDLVLMDIKLKGKEDGIEAARQISSQANIPVIFITAITDKETVARAKTTGPYGFVYKPIEEKELYSAIEMALYKHKMEAELRKSEVKFRRFFENDPDYCYMVSPEGLIMDVNTSALRALGYKKAELVGKPIKTIYDSDSYQKLASKEHKAGETTGKQADEEMVIITKNGQRLTVLLRADVVKDHAGKILYALSVQRDITGRKQAEEELIRLSTAVRMSTDSIVLSDIQGKITDVNEATLKMFGAGDRDDLIGKNGFDFIVPEEQRRAKKVMQEVLGKGYSRGEEYHIMTKNGSSMPVEMSAAVLKDSEGNPMGFVAISRDITERRRSEEEKSKLQSQLAHSEKMAGIGTLAGGVAHEFNNMLQIIQGHVEYANKTNKQGDIKEAFGIVMSYTEKAAKIIKDLLTFSSEQMTARQRTDVAELIESVLSLSEGHFRKHNVVITKNYQKVPPIKINRGEMQQVFLQMITNARDAMFPGGGKLSIEVKKAGNTVKTIFRDTGTGIDQENLNKIFEPFFTTKGSGGKSSFQGTGLGLSVSYGIVKRHGGMIEVESKKGKGATFTILLPLAGGKTRKTEINRNSCAGKKY